MASIHLSKGIVTELKLAFEREAKRMCKDAAHILRVPEKDLTKQVLDRLQKTSLAVIQDDDLPRECPVLLQYTQSSIVERCRCVTVLGTARCFQHQKEPNPPDSIQASTCVLTRISLPNWSEEPVWVNEATNEVVNRQGEIIGERIDETITFYEYEEA